MSWVKEGIVEYDQKESPLLGTGPKRVPVVSGKGV